MGVWGRGLGGGLGWRSEVGYKVEVSNGVMAYVTCEYGVEKWRVRYTVRVERWGIKFW